MARTKDLSEAEKNVVRADICEKLKELSEIMDSNGIREARDKFVEKFILCETVYKVVLKKYLQVNNRFIGDKNMKLQIEQIKASLRRAGYRMDEQLLNRIFSSSGLYSVRGSKSAKMLRNGIEHEMNPKDLQEVYDRQDCLIADMDRFIALIQE